MKPNLVLIQTSSKFCVKITGTEEGLQNPKNWSQDQTGGSIKDKTKKTKQNKTKQKTKTKQNKKKELQPGSEVHFEIKNWTTWVHTSAQER